MADETRSDQPDDSEPTQERQAQANTPGDCWAAPITPERAAELKELADRQRAWAATPDHQGRESYFKGVWLTGADVFWLAAYARAGLDGDMAAAQELLLMASARGKSIASSFDLSTLHLEPAELTRAHLERANLEFAHLENATLDGAYLERAELMAAHLEEAMLFGTHLEGADLFGAHLEGAVLGLAFLNTATILDDIHLGNATSGTVRVADVRWGGVNLAVVDWAPFTDGQVLLGDEQVARDFKPEPFTETEEQRKRPRQARAKHAAQQDQKRLGLYQAAVRANRQLATALRDQGMNEEADHFAYRAQVLQRRVFGQQGKRGRRFLSWFLDLVAGYGYRPGRSVIAYLTVILSFAGIYYVLGQQVGPPLPPLAAVVFSITSFHGRGFFAGSIPSLTDPLVVFAAAEAVVGLLIEITFIATFTQRFFAR